MEKINKLIIRLGDSKMDFNDMKALAFEIKNLHDKVEIYSKSNDMYIQMFIKRGLKNIMIY